MALPSIIICPDSEVASRLESALTDLGQVNVCRVFTDYPGLTDLVHTLRAHAPDIVFLSFESIPKAHETMRLLEKEVEGIQIIAVHRVCDAAVLRDTMRLGVREFVEFPFERQTLIDSVLHTATLLERQPVGYQATTRIFSFLPSKAGVGTSTLALNASAAIARRPETRVLLSDFDLNSGMLRFLLKLRNEFSVLDAVEHSVAMDENLWPQLVSPIAGMDVLHGGRVNPNLRIEPTQIRNLMQFMRRNYDVLCFDLSGNLERYSVEIMQQSKRVYLVCTPELPSLHLALEKIQFLKTVDLDGRVSVVLNRFHKKSLFGKEQVEQILGHPVMETVPNDYIRVNRATATGSVVDESSDLGKKYSEFGAKLCETAAPQAAEGRRKFLEFFSVSGPPALRRP